MKTISFIFSALFLLNLHAESGIDKTLADQKKAEIQSSTLPASKAQMTKIAGKPVEIEVDWPTFEGQSYTSYEQLGTELLDLVRKTQTGFEESPDYKKNFVKNINKVKFIFIKNAPITLKYNKESKTLFLSADFGSLDWSSFGSFKEAVQKAIKG